MCKLAAKAVRWRHKKTKLPCPYQFCYLVYFAPKSVVLILTDSTPQSETIGLQVNWLQTIPFRPPRWFTTRELISGITCVTYKWNTFWTFMSSSLPLLCKKNYLKQYIIHSQYFISYIATSVILTLVFLAHPGNWRAVELCQGLISSANTNNCNRTKMFSGKIRGVLLRMIHVVLRMGAYQVLQMRTHPDDSLLPLSDSCNAVLLLEGEETYWTSKEFIISGRSELNQQTTTLVYYTGLTKGRPGLTSLQSYISNVPLGFS